MTPQTGSALLLDTSIVVDYLRGSIQAKGLLSSRSVLVLPTVALGELYYGALHARSSAKQVAQLKQFLPAVVVMGTDERTSELYGRIRVELSLAGQPIPDNDIWIAAIAIQHSLPLATRDQHFRRITALDVRFV